MILFIVNGIARLREDYKNPKDVKYYAILDASAQDVEYGHGQGKSPSPKFQIEVPITKVGYDKLKENLEKSKAESPVLRVKGQLELILGSESFA